MDSSETSAPTPHASSPSTAASPKKSPVIAKAAKASSGRLSPSDFVRNNPKPKAEHFREIFSFEAIPYLVVCIYGFPEWLRDFDAHLENDPKLPDTLTAVKDALDWIEGVSRLLRAAGETLDTYLADRHGDSYFVKRKDRAGIPKEIQINPQYHAERFAITRRIGYDAVNHRHLQYKRATGVWEAVPPEALREEAGEYWKDFADSFTAEPQVRAQALAMRKMGFLQDCIKLSDSYANFFPAPLSSVLHARNCVVAVSGKQERRPFSPVLFSRGCLSVDFVKSAEAVDFEKKYLKAALDEDDIKLLRLWAGSVLLGVNYFSKILIATGTGGTGKSVFMLIMQEIIGEENCIELRTKTLSDKYTQGRFIGKKLLLGLDVPPDYLLSPATVELKKLTGNDIMSPEIRGSQVVPRMRGTFNVGVTSNSRLKLKLHGDDKAWERRLLLVEFSSKKKIKVDRDFVKSIVAKEGPGILTWMITGARQILHMKQGKQPDWPLSEKQIQRRQEMLEESNSLPAFLKNEVVAVAQGSSLTTDELYDAYCAYCDQRKWVPAVKGEVTRALPSLMIEYFASKLRTNLKRKNAQGEQSNKRGYARVRLKSSIKTLGPVGTPAPSEISVSPSSDTEDTDVNTKAETSPASVEIAPSLGGESAS